MNDNIIYLTNDQFAKIFNNAYAVIIDGIMYDVFNDYETEDQELCTAFVEANESNYDVAYVIPRHVEEGRVSYDKLYHEFYFEDQRDCTYIPRFKVLTVATIEG